MILANKLKKTIALGMICVSIISSAYFGEFSSNAATTSYYKKSVTVNFKVKKGIKKVVINNKKVKVKVGTKKYKRTFTKQGRYTVKITNKSGKTTTKVIVIDKTKPTFIGVSNGGTYNNQISFKAKDNFKLASTVVNGKSIKGICTITEAGTYTAIAKDKAGNKRSITFTVTGTMPNVTSGDAVTADAITSTGTATSSQNPTVTPTQTPTDSNNTGSTFQETTPQLNCEHVWVQKSISEKPTCYSSGIALYQCSLCSGTKREELPKVEHDYSKLVTDERYEVKKATCTEAGEYHYCCAYCGEATTKTGTVSSIGHKFSKKIATTEYLKEAATLEHGDIYYLACMHCGEKGADTWDNERKLDHTTHTFSDRTIADETNMATEATCTKAATYYYKCTGCNTFDTEHTFEAGEPLGHDYSEKTIKEVASCEHGNIYACKCSRCNTYAPESTDDGMKLEHEYEQNPIEKYLATEATCTKAATYYRACKMCGEKASDTFSYGNLAEHEFIKSDTEVKAEASCTDPRMYYYTCKDCGTKGTETYASTKANEQAHGHSSVRIKENKYEFEAATCGHGTKYYYGCENCKAVDTTQIWDDGNKLPHDYQETEETQYMKIFSNATCVEPNKYFKVCTMCHAPSNSKDCIFSFGDALGHDFSQQKTVQEATSSSDRTYQMKCSRCEESKSEIHTDVGSHTDHNGPEIYYKFTAADGAAIGSTTFATSNYIYSGDHFGLSSTTKGNLDITVRDNGSGIRSIETYTWFGDQECSYDSSNNIISSKTTSWNTVQRLTKPESNIGPIATLGIEANWTTKYLYQFIRATDWAGNTTTIRTCNLILK